MLPLPAWQILYVLILLYHTFIHFSVLFYVDAKILLCYAPFRYPPGLYHKEVLA